MSAFAHRACIQHNQNNCSLHTPTKADGPGASAAIQIATLSGARVSYVGVYAFAAYADGKPSLIKISSEMA